MAIPTLLLTPGESRDRAGVIETEVSGIVDVAADAWHLWRGVRSDGAMMLLSPDGSFDRSGPISPTQSLPVTAGTYGDAWRSEQASTNWMLNPSAETNLTNWGNVGLGVTLDRVAGDAVVGEYAVQVTCDGSSSTIQGALAHTSTITPASGVNIGTKITGSAFVKAPAGAKMRLLIRENNAAAVYSVVPFTGTGGWQRISCTHTVTATNVAFHVRVDNGGQTNTPVTFLMDAVQLEIREYATLYLDGSLGLLHSWSSTAHASVSSRSFPGIYFPLSRSPFQDKRGTMLVRGKFRYITSFGQFLGVMSESGGAGLGFGRYVPNHATFGRAHFLSGGNGATYPPAIPDEAFVSLAVKFFPNPSSPSDAGWMFRMYRSDGTVITSTFPLGADLTLFRRTYVVGSTSGSNLDYESGLFFEEDLDDATIWRFLNTPKRWEWGPDGTITAPHPEPLGSVLVRYRAAGVIHTAHLVGPGTFGTHGTVSHDGDTLTIGTTRDIEVLGAVAWPTELDSPDAAKFSAMETWAWSDLLPKIGGILRMSSPEPLVISRSTSPEPIVISRTHQEL